MSEYVTCKTEFSDPELLIEALMAAGKWTRDQIEFHEEAQNLVGYERLERPQKGHIIIRKKDVGRSSNDIGFERMADGKFQSHVSDYDQGRHGKSFQAKIKTEYGFRIIKRQQEARGRRVSRATSPSGKTRLVIEGYR
jgi:hypothetical protein